MLGIKMGNGGLMTNGSATLDHLEDICFLLGNFLLENVVQIRYITQPKHYGLPPEALHLDGAGPSSPQQPHTHWPLSAGVPVMRSVNG